MQEGGYIRIKGKDYNISIGYHGVRFGDIVLQNYFTGGYGGKWIAPALDAREQVAAILRKATKEELVLAVVEFLAESGGHY